MKKWLRVVVRLVALIVSVVLVCYLWSRMFSADKAVTVRKIDAGVVSRGGEELVVGCYNIAHGRGGEFGAGNRRADGKDGLLKHLQAIGKLLWEQNLDVVVLNEVDFSSSWSWRVNQAEEIAKVAGLPYVLEQRSYDMTLLFYELRFGNAVLSRYPIRDAERIDLPAFKTHEKMFLGRKNASTCLVETPMGAVRIVPIHLEHRDEATRQASMNVLKSAITFDNETPHLLMGDFNTAEIFPGSAELTAAEPPSFTFPSEKPDRTIDWIVTTPLISVENLKTFGGDLSDHLGLRAVVREIAIDKRDGRP